MAARKKAPDLYLPVKPWATAREILAVMRKNFTAADLQKYTEIEEGIPAEKVLADMETLLKKLEREKQAKSRKKGK